MADDANDSPWPLVVTYAPELEAERNYSPDDLLESSVRMLYLTAKKELEKAGRMGDVRRLKLTVYNKEKE
jgi:hypothetical protein